MPALWVSVLLSFFIRLMPGARAEVPLNEIPLNEVPLRIVALTEGGCGFQGQSPSEIVFRNIEMMNLNARVGLHREETLRLRSFISTTDTSFIGLDESERLIWVIQFKERPMAYLLSGDLRLQAYFFSDDGQLVGIDAGGSLYQFSPREWSRSRLPDHIASGVKQAGLSTCTLGLAFVLVQMIAADSNLQLNLSHTLKAWAASSGLAAVFHAWWIQARYEATNEAPNGFLPLATRIRNFTNVNMPEGNGFGVFGLTDYRLATTGPHSHSLVELLRIDPKFKPEWRSDFRESCTMKLLARGRSEREIFKQKN